MVGERAGDLRAVRPESPESLAEQLLELVADGTDVPVEIVHGIGCMMAADADHVLVGGPHAVERAATWALGVRQRVAAARRLLAERM